jgi:transposase
MLTLIMNFIGIDVGKTYLDIADNQNNLTIRVRNTEKDYEKILSKFPGKNTVCMEATGIYYLNIAKYLSKSNWIVFVVNPRIIKSYKDSLLSRTKTDKVDSIHISKFVSERHSDLNRFVVKSDSLFKLTILVNFIESLKKQKTQTKNRLHAVSFVEPTVFPEFQQSIDLIDKQIQILQERALLNVRADKYLKTQFEALLTLPGFGEINALNLLVVSGGFDRFKSAKAFACFCGITPRFHESGQLKMKSVTSRMGPSQARRVLWLAAFSSARTDSLQGKRFRRMVASGKKPSVALVAIANSLARAAWVVVSKASMIKADVC